MKTGYMIQNYQWHRSTLYFFHESWTKTIQYILTKHHYIINMFKRVSTSTRGKVYWHIWETSRPSGTSHIRSILIGIYFVKVIRKCKLLILFQEIQPLKYIETCWNHIQQFGRLLDNTYWWDAEYGNEIYWIHACCFESQRDENFQLKRVFPV